MAGSRANRISCNAISARRRDAWRRRLQCALVLYRRQGWADRPLWRSLRTIVLHRQGSGEADALSPQAFGTQRDTAASFVRSAWWSAPGRSSYIEYGYLNRLPINSEY